MSSATNSRHLKLVRTMGHCDLRYAMPIFINLLKSQSEAGLPNPYEWDNWDPFHFFINPRQTTWTNLCFTVFMLLLYSVTSVKVPITSPLNNTTHLIRFQLGNFSLHLSVLLVGSLMLPRDLFWYAYPAIIIFVLFFSSILFLLWRFLGWVNKKLEALPVWNLHINSTLTHHHQLEAEIDIESQAPLPLPQDGEYQISPEDGHDSYAEANDETLAL